MNISSVIRSVGNTLPSLFTKLPNTPIGRITLIAAPLFLLLASYALWRRNTTPLPPPVLPPYPEVATQALRRAQELLAQNPAITPHQCNRNGRAIPLPRNLEIAKLRTLCHIKYTQFVVAASKQSFTFLTFDPIRDLMDDCITLAYAIAVKSLEEMPQHASSFWGRKTYVQMLVDTNASLFCPVGLLSNLYHQFRSCASIEKVDGEDVLMPIKDQDALEQHGKTYFVPGKMEYRWRLLFNDYCDRVACYAPREEIKKLNSQVARWLIKEETPPPTDTLSRADYRFAVANNEDFFRPIYRNSIEIP